MSNITSNPQYIQQPAVQFRAAVSESVGTAIGGSINYLLDVVTNLSINILNIAYISTPTWTIPTNLAGGVVFFFGCGGGGGGGGGGGSSGNGATGGAGGSTTVQLPSSAYLCTFYGAAPGVGGTSTTPGVGGRGWVGIDGTSAALAGGPGVGGTTGYGNGGNGGAGGGGQPGGGGGATYLAFGYGSGLTGGTVLTITLGAGGNGGLGGTGGGSNGTAGSSGSLFAVYSLVPTI